MRSPFLPGGPGNEIPAQVVHRYDLSGHIWLGCFIPNYFPGISAVGKAEIAYILDWSDWSTPVQTHSHLSVGIGGVKWTRVEPLETGERA